MKNVLFLLGFLLIVSKAWATPDWAPATEYSSSTQVTTSNAAVCNVTVTGVGVTVGDYITLSNSASGATTPVQLRVTAPTANFSTNIQYGSNPCNLFTSGVYLKESASSGTLYTDIQYLNAI